MPTPYCIWSFCLHVSLGKLCSVLFKVTQLELLFKVMLASVSYTTCVELSLPALHCTRKCMESLNIFRWSHYHLPVCSMLIFLIFLVMMDRNSFLNDSQPCCICHLRPTLRLGHLDELVISQGSR